jgi:hypothetical protein
VNHPPSFSCRCLNTASVFMLDSFTTVFSRPSLHSLMLVLLANCLSPLVSLVNLPQRLQQIFLAPRAQSQAKVRVA